MAVALAAELEAAVVSLGNGTSADPEKPPKSRRVSTLSGSPCGDNPGEWLEATLRAKYEAICPTCLGRAFLVYDVGLGDPKFGKLLSCPKCGGHREEDSLQALCGLSPEMQGWTFENTMRHDGIAAAFDTARRLARKPQRFLTLLGGFGLGKTRLLACIVNEARGAGLPAVYTTTANLLDHLRGAYAPGAAASYDARLEMLTNASVLCLDEFDRYHSTDWAEEKFFQLIEARYQRGQEQLTCFAANKALEELPPYLRSRIEDRQCHVYELAGQDVRRRRR